MTIVWETAAACPLKNETVTEQCTMPLSQGNFMFDLNPLQRSPPYYVKSGDQEFELNICGPVEGHCKSPSSSPGVNVSACKVDSKKNSGDIIGVFSGSVLEYENEELKLIYTTKDIGMYFFFFFLRVIYTLFCV